MAFVVDGVRRFHFFFLTPFSFLKAARLRIKVTTVLLKQIERSGTCRTDLEIACLLVPVQVPGIDHSKNNTPYVVPYHTKSFIIN
jgi:hypothetical protein